MQLRSALLAATVLATPIAASAQPVTGLYVGGGAGVNLLTAEKFSGPAELDIGTGKLHASAGFVGVVSLGWGFGNGLRAELEGSYRNNAFNGTSGFGVTGFTGGGREQKYGPMVNVLYDFNGLTPWLVPYLGVGVGYQWVNEQGTNAHGGFPPTTFGVANGSKGSFAYQGIVGAAVPLTTMVPGLAFTAEYRFLGLAGHRSYGGSITGPLVAGGFTPATFVSQNHFNHSFLLGLRYNFGVAPPPPPAPAPVPAQAPARSYLVFFDWDKATLTDRARQIIREAADNSTKVQYTRIEVNGYTDTSGTPKYNQGLSVRRARAVQAELVKDGVPANAITIQGFGDTHLLVPTGPGVREPQNRRVEIIIR
jgi:OmpA-OmpF porin, OOP family